MVISSNGSSPLSTLLTLSLSTVLVHAPTTSAATALPEKFVSARGLGHEPVDATMSPTPSSSSGRWACSPPASVAKPAPLTPAAPYAIMNNSRPTCSATDNGSPNASAMNSDAMVR